MRRNQQFTLFAACAIGFCSNAMANLSFTGTLRVPPPCTINNGATIAIDFAEMGTNRVDGTNYKKTLTYSISCTSSTMPWSMYLTVTGVATDFDPAAVKTDKDHLGIKILQNDLPFTLNTKVQITAANPPTLKVVPVKRPGATLGEGTFNAVAVLVAHHE